MSRVSGEQRWRSDRAGAAIIGVAAQAKTEQIKSGQTTVTMSPLVKALLRRRGSRSLWSDREGRRRLAVDADGSGPMSVPSMNGR